MLPFLIFNIHSVVSSAFFALVMDIVAVDRPVTGSLITATQASEIGIVLICGYDARLLTFRTFHLDAGGKGVVCTVCKVGSINDSAHTLSRSSHQSFSK